MMLIKMENMSSKNEITKKNCDSNLNEDERTNKKLRSKRI